MKTLKTIGILIISILIQIIFIVPKTVIFVISILESILKIVREQITFLMKQIKYEVLKPIRDGKKNEELKEGAEGDS